MPDKSLDQRTRLQRFADRLHTRWHVASYNFAWPGYVWILDGPISKLSLLVPIIGYAILFNDTVANHLKFAELAQPVWPWMTAGARLKLLYFGLAFLGTANALYLWLRPYVLRRGVNLDRYIDNTLRYATFGDIQRMHFRIREGHYTQDGKYYDADWDAFKVTALGEETNPHGRTGSDPKSGDWNTALEKHGSLLRSIFSETYFRESRERRAQLVVCLFFALLGSMLLAIPGLELFARVALATVFSVS